MRKSEVWELVHAERHHLIDDLTDLPRDAWETPTACRNWTVHDVLAHQLDTAATGKWAFIWSMMRAKGDFDQTNIDGIQRCKRDDPHDTLADYQAIAHYRRIPTAHRATRLVEVYLHGEDIRRPLGITGSYPAEGVHDALTYQLRTPTWFGGGRERAAGYRLIDSATGAAWGEGIEVTGAAIDLFLAVSGRPVSAELLDGPGAAQLVG